MTAAFDSIADSLAEHGYAVHDQFLSQKEVAAILALPAFEAGVNAFKKAGIGKNQERVINESIRGDYIHWIDPQTAAPATGVYLERMHELLLFMNRALFLSLKDFEVHMTIYPAGSYYKRHLDQFKKDDRRKLSAICYLNEAWKNDHGGELVMYLPEGERRVLPTAGKLVIFRSDQIEHEVLPATRDRLSLTGWMLDRLEV